MSDSKRGMDRGLTSYGDVGFSRFLRRAFIKGMGYSEEALSKPVVGIANTFSGYNACHANAPDLVEAVKRGVMLKRLPCGRLSDDFAARELRLSDLDVSAEPDGARHRGDAARPADGCRRAGRRLRQDRPGPIDGGDQCRHAGGAIGDRPDDDGLTSGCACGRLHRLPPVLGLLSCRGGRRDGNCRGQRAIGPRRRYLFGNGDREHHGADRGGPGHGAAQFGDRAGGIRRSQADRRSVRRGGRLPCREPGHAGRHCHASIDRERPTGFCLPSADRPTASFT